MSTSTGAVPNDPVQLILDEADKRLDTYYEAVRPGDEDSAIPAMDMEATWIIVAVSVSLIVLWLIGRFVILPIYV